MNNKYTSEGTPTIDILNHYEVHATCPKCNDMIGRHSIMKNRKCNLCDGILIWAKNKNFHACMPLGNDYSVCIRCPKVQEALGGLK